MTDDTSSKRSKAIKGLVLTGVVSVVLLLGLYATGLVFGFFPMWYQNYGPKQPIPFSHKTHAGKFNISCMYCHGSAEYAAHAEVPGLEVCMNCHSQVKKDSPWIKQMTEAYNKNEPIAWVKVHVLPDFVNFKHSPHIKAGVECQDCHGEVEKMDKVFQAKGMNMGWCLDCHRNNDKVSPERKEIWKKKKQMMGVGEEESLLNKVLGHPDLHNADVTCSTCHY